MIIDENNYKEFLSNDGNVLDCSNKEVSEIKYLPESLIRLYCENNNLTSLPKLPESLKVLYCEYNNLIYLPELPKLLKGLYCHNNKLISLPELPGSLDRLVCHNNKLPIQGAYRDKKQVKDYTDKMNQYELINNILEKI
jgi:Leucine-rich repeat (LRR) protein